MTPERQPPFSKLIAEYGSRPHPLDYKNIYQLLVMVVLSAQDSDDKINALGPALFEVFPDMKSLSQASIDELLPYLSKVRGHRKKISWLLEIAGQLKSDKNIPLNMEGLVALKGIGRKSANVIIREADARPEGIMVDLHVLRVISRIGISQANTGDKMERDLMQEFPQSMWKDLGMSVSYLGREICRPTNPQHAKCIMNKVCNYCLEKQAQLSAN